MKLYLGDFRYREVPVDGTREGFRSGRAEAAVGIHEGQLTYEGRRARRVVDLGEWWLLETGLPLPLGVNTGRGAMREETLREALRLRRRSGRGSRCAGEAMRYAMQFGRGLDSRLADRFVGMYVNELTCDYGDEGRPGRCPSFCGRRGDRRLPGAGCGSSSSARFGGVSRAVGIVSAVRAPVLALRSNWRGEKALERGLSCCGGNRRGLRQSGQAEFPRLMENPRAIPKSIKAAAT